MISADGRKRIYHKPCYTCGADVHLLGLVKHGRTLCYRCRRNEENARDRREKTLARSDLEVLQARQKSRGYFRAQLFNGRPHATNIPKATCACGAVALYLVKTKGQPTKAFCKKHKP